MNKAEIDSDSGSTPSTLAVRLVPVAGTTAVVARGVSSLDDDAVPARERERLRLLGFTGRVGQAQLVTADDGAVSLVVGLGRRERLDPLTLRRVAGAMTRAATQVPTLATTLVEDVDGVIDRADAAAAIAAGALSVRYRFEAHRGTPSADGPSELLIVDTTGAPVTAAAVDRAVVLARGIALARDLVNEPGGTLTPTEFARRIDALAGERVRVVVHDLAAIRDLGMGGLLGVNRGSAQEPRFVEVHYEPPSPTGRTLALVGKGITFDSGGINLKKQESSLIVMKGDMGGAAAVVGAMSVLADLDVGAKVSAYLPLTDNMTGGDATRPGDVLRMYDGRTLEVLNTDAEGRIVLSDAVAYARDHADADAIVDVATLTATIIHATGWGYAGLFAKDETLGREIQAAAEGTADGIWPLPRVPELVGMLRSKIADLNNRMEAPAASAFAGLLIEQFAGDVPFAHIDMNSVNLRDRDGDDGPAGARGWGVEMLVRLAESFAAPPPD